MKFIKIFFLLAHLMADSGVNLYIAYLIVFALYVFHFGSCLKKAFVKQKEYEELGMQGFKPMVLGGFLINFIAGLFCYMVIIGVPFAIIFDYSLLTYKKRTECLTKDFPNDNNSNYDNKG